MSGDSERARHGDALLASARALIRAETAGLAALEAQLGESFLAAVEVLLRTRGKVLTAGVGTSGEIARRMAHLLAVTGTPSLFVHPADGLHGRLGAVTREDVVIAISKGGESDEVNEFARRAGARGAFIIALTGDRSSSLAQIADLAVELQSNPEAEPGGIIAMGSTLVTAAWGDALAVVVRELRGYAWDTVLFTHPGGAVGQNALLRTDPDSSRHAGNEAEGA